MRCACALPPRAGSHYLMSPLSLWFMLHLYAVNDAFSNSIAQSVEWACEMFQLASIKSKYFLQNRFMEFGIYIYIYI